MSDKATAIAPPHWSFTSLSAANYSVVSHVPSLQLVGERERHDFGGIADLMPMPPEVPDKAVLRAAGDASAYEQRAERLRLAFIQLVAHAQQLMQVSGLAHKRRHGGKDSFLNKGLPRGNWTEIRKALKARSDHKFQPPRVCFPDGTPLLNIKKADLTRSEHQIEFYYRAYVLARAVYSRLEDSHVPKPSTWLYWICSETIAQAELPPAPSEGSSPLLPRTKRYKSNLLKTAAQYIAAGESPFTESAPSVGALIKHAQQLGPDDAEVRHKLKMLERAMQLWARVQQRGGAGPHYGRDRHGRIGVVKNEGFDCCIDPTNWVKRPPQSGVT